MKNLLLTLVVLSILFIIGCDDNSITAPVQPTDNELSKISDEFNQYNTIELNQFLSDPHAIGNSHYTINGEISYQFTMVPYNLNSKVPSHIVYLNLSLKAGITNHCTVCEPPFNNTPAGTISTKTNDTIYLIKNGTHLLEKSFSIQGEEDEMYLVCRFIISPNGIELDRMVLELVEQDDTDVSQMDL
jgi:hypothetical protein